MIKKCALLTFILCLHFGLITLSASAAVFPGREWECRAPESLGVDAGMLTQLEALLGGRGCVIKDGYVVHAWGDQSERGDWASSAKPVLSTLVFFAMQEGLIESVDQPVADFGWEFRPKDQGITFRHLGGMMSGYARPEGPGEAWAYNDYAIQLYQKTIFDKVFCGDAKEVAEAPNRFGALGLQDGLEFTERRRLSASVRDFARICWFWMNHGRWNGRQVLPERYFDLFMCPQTPFYLPNSIEAETNDYLGIGTYGGESSHFSKCGPGIYGFNWWFNGTGRAHPFLRNWPDAPVDTFMTLGVRGNTTAMVPSLGLLLVTGDANWGEQNPGDHTTPMNQALRLLAASAGYVEPPAQVTGAMRKCQAVTLTFQGADTGEHAADNPFLDYRLDVTFTCGKRAHTVPGYYAADGNAGESGADAGGVWRARFLPEAAGRWMYRVSFRRGVGIAVSEDPEAGTPAALDGVSGEFMIGEADVTAPGFLNAGVLRHENGRYPRFSETGEYFLKGGADSPENLLAFADFDQTTPSHQFAPHAYDWRSGDPVWRDGKGRNLIGALNYLAGKGMNSVYFLTMNVGGDGKDVWPWTAESERVRFDCSKLDQWETVFGHMDRLGLMLHVVLQEQENDQLLDGGALGPERRLYHRELVARFAHHPALVWNLGEENTNTDAQRRAFAAHIRSLDTYAHPIVLHTYPSERDTVYRPMLGAGVLDGLSLQITDMRDAYPETLKWVRASAESGTPWIVALDEIGPPDTGVKPDEDDPDHDEVRRFALWGSLMAGGAGCEWLFGHRFAHNDINCEDWRSRDCMWDQTRHAISFFQQYLPFAEMTPWTEGIRGEGVWCFAKPGKLYALYAPDPALIRLDLPACDFQVRWYDPRNGGALIEGALLHGSTDVNPGPAPNASDKDWVLLIERQRLEPHRRR